MKFVKYDITFEIEREVFIAYGFPPHVDYEVVLTSNVKNVLF